MKVGVGTFKLLSAPIMRVGVVAIFLVSTFLAIIASQLSADSIEKEIVRNAIKNHWMDLKNYELKQKKPANFTGDLMQDILHMKFRPGHPRATKIAMARIIQERILKEVEEKFLEAKGHNRTRRDISANLSPSSLAEIFQAVHCEELLPRPNCDRKSLFVRTIDATCNNLIFQSHGSAFGVFNRLLPALYEDGIELPRGFKVDDPFKPPIPSARQVSLLIHQNGNQASTEANINEPFITHMVMQWGQFLDHDVNYLIEGGEGNEMIDLECIESNKHRETEFCINIPVDRDDPLFATLQKFFKRDTLPFERAAASCFLPLISAGPRNREIINQITSYIDASMVYGSLEEEERALRLFKGGLLLEAADQTLPSSLSNIAIPRGTLPISTTPTMPPCVNNLNCFMAGDRRVSEQFSLSIMHTIFLREHNRVAKNLARLNPSWSDEAIFQVARRIITAEIQVIVYKEYLPVILGSRNVLKLIGLYKGYNASVDPRIPNEFAHAAYRYGHSQIRSGFPRFDANWRRLRELPLLNAFFNSRLFFDPKTGGTDPIIRGLLNAQSRRLDEFINMVLTNRLFKNLVFEDPLITPPLDLAARNIQRGRDNGLPTHHQVQKFCHEVFDIESDFRDPRTLRRLQSLYGKDLSTVDLFAGGLSERRLPGSLLGATFSCVVALTFRNIRDGDRFFYLNEGVFTTEQVSEIEKVSLSRIICDNTQINSVQRNAFRTGSRVSCRNIAELDLEVFKNDRIGEMIENDDFSLPSFPGQKDTVRLNNQFLAYLVQQQADLTAVNDLKELIGSTGEETNEGGFPANNQPRTNWIKVELVPLTYSSPVIRTISSVSIQSGREKKDSQRTMFESRRSSGPATACLEIFPSTRSSKSQVFVTPEILSSSVCSLSFISTSLRGRKSQQNRNSVSTTIPSSATEADGVYASLDECKMGEKATSNNFRVSVRPTIGVAFKFNC